MVRGLVLRPMENVKSIFVFKNLGLISYQEAYQVQLKTVAEVISGAPSMVFLCEHPAVLTLGRLAAEQNILASPAELTKRKVELAKIDRGGEVTLHNPGQLVVYPIINLNEHGRDLRVYLHKVEQVAIDLLGDFDILAKRIEGQRGVWVKNCKIASIGIGVKKWVAYHGIAINVCNDLNLFSIIRPCGLDVRMASIESLKASKITMADVKNRFMHHWSRNFSA